jgi:hypothetical protein
MILYDGFEVLSEEAMHAKKQVLAIYSDAAAYYDIPIHYYNIRIFRSRNVKELAGGSFLQWPSIDLSDGWHLTLCEAWISSWQAIQYEIIRKLSQ